MRAAAAKLMIVALLLTCASAAEAAPVGSRAAVTRRARTQLRARHQPRGLRKLLLRGKRFVRRAWLRLNRRPTRRARLAPLQRMLRSGRISGGDADRVRQLFGLSGARSEQNVQRRIERHRSQARYRPLFQLYDAGRLSTQQMDRAIRATSGR